MNWQMIGALGEVGGAIAVVLTLAYLARQVRDASLQDQRNRWVQLGHRSDELRLLLTRDPEFVTIFLRGVADLTALNPVERARFSAWLLTFFEVNGSYFQFMKEGAVHPMGAEAIDASTKEILLSLGVQQWYAGRRSWFADDYAAQLDQWISAGGPSVVERIGRDGAATP